MINAALIILFALLLIHYSYFLFQIIKGLKNLSNIKKGNGTNKFVSVIIPFRNEAVNLPACLKSLEQQFYPDDKYEVIFVDDSSTDDSFNILKKEISSPKFKVLKFEGENLLTAHKKQAIKFGIEKTAGEIIVTTDADCIHDKNWLKSILECFDDNTALVSGPVEFEDNGTVFSKMQKLEFAGLILTGAGLIGINRPIICNGANLAYRKKVYYKVGGFSDQIQLSSGEDELLMQKIRQETNYKIKFCLNKEGIVKTKTNNSFTDFYHQRKRWASKGLFYGDPKLIIKLILIFLFYLGLIFQIILGLSTSKIFFLTAIISLLSKNVLEFQIIKKGKANLFPDLKLKYFPLTEIFQIPYIIIAAISGLFGNFRWKERDLKR